MHTHRKGNGRKYRRAHKIDEEGDGWKQRRGINGRERRMWSQIW